MAGTQSTVDTTRRFDGAGAWSDDGLSRARPTPVLDGDIVRRLDVGQVAYVYRGGATFLQIKRLTGKQAAIGPGSASIIAGGVAGDAGRGAGQLAGVGASAAGRDSRWPAGVRASGEPPTIPLPLIGAAPGPGAFFTAAERVSGATPLPDVSEVLDDAFGARRD